MQSIKERMMRVKELIANGEYDEAEVLLMEIDHPTAQDWLDRVRYKKGQERVRAIKGQKVKRSEKNENSVNIVNWVLISIIVLGSAFLLSLPLLVDIDSLSIATNQLGRTSEQTQSIPTALPDTTPIPETNAYALIGARAYWCPYEECETAPVYQDEVLTLTGIIEGMNLEGSDQWYEARRNNEVLYVHMQSISFSGPTPIVPTRDWRAETNPVYGGQQAGVQSGGQSQNTSYSCDCSRTCAMMSSCEEAYFQLNTCGCGERDGDNDGIPCEINCRR